MDTQPIGFTGFPPYFIFFKWKGKSVQWNQRTNANFFVFYFYKAIYFWKCGITIAKKACWRLCTKQPIQDEATHLTFSKDVGRLLEQMG